MSDQSVVEKHTIGYVPPEDRHGKVRDLFTLTGVRVAPRAPAEVAPKRN